MSASRAEHQDWLPLILVGVGGALGTLLRFAITALVPTLGDVPLATMTVNLTGAFLLGLLLERLKVRDPETQTARAIRLGVGTGVLGSYTTYSALAVGADGLIDTGNVTVGLLVAIPTVAAGVVVAALGARVARMAARKGAK